MKVKTCMKERFRSKADASARRFVVTRTSADLGFTKAYQCPTCRFPDGQKAWHWGHRRAHGRKRQKR